MSKVGLTLIYLWVGFNLLLALSIVVSMSLLGINAPALTMLFDSSAVGKIAPDALSTINALAVLTNSAIAALCGLTLVIIRKGLLKQRWAFISVGLCLGFVQGMGFVSDNYFGNKNLTANVISTLILLAGFLLSAPMLGESRKRT